MVHYSLLLQAAEEGVTASRVVREYAGFLSFFAVYGAVGFHFQVLKELRAQSTVEVAGSPVDRADRRAAAIGFAGAVLMIVLMISSLLQRAGQKHITLVAAISAGGGRQIF